MGYPNTKIYSDGSHYIGIPETHRTMKKKKHQHVKPKDKNSVKPPTVKDEFNRIYQECSSLPKKEKEEMLVISLASKFKDIEMAERFVKVNLERVLRNKLERMKRLMRKVRLQQWNYFLTFTYDDKKHTEESFRKSLTNCLRHLSSRKAWKYVGVWERAPTNNRLHFHCIAYIEKSQMIGTITEQRDYDTQKKKMQITYPNSHFLEQYGRNDFKEIIPQELPSLIGYLVKYIDKSGEKLVYSRGLPTYFVSDILDDDVACPYGVDDRKLLLFDNFLCMDDGEILGTVSQEIIQKLPKSN